MYVDDVEFLAELILSQKEPTERLGQFLQLVAQIAVAKTCPNYKPREDLIQDTLLELLRMYKNYDLSNKKPYLFFEIHAKRFIRCITVRQLKKDKLRKFFEYSVDLNDGKWMTEEDIELYNTHYIKYKERLKRGKNKTAELDCITNK